MKYLALVIMLGFRLSGWEQDTLILMDKTESLVKLLKIGNKNVTYKMWDNPEGPEYVVSVWHVAKIKYFDPKHVRTTATAKPDTIVLADNTLILATIFKTNKFGIKYGNWESPDDNTHHMRLNKILMLRYRDGRVVTQDDLLDPNYKMAISYGPQYDLLMKLNNRRAIPGGILVGVGPACIVSSWGLFIAYSLEEDYNGNYSPFSNGPPPNYRAQRGFFGGGIALVSFGLASTITGAVLLAQSRPYRKRAQLIKKGIISMSYPQPDFILPTAQNNFQKGFGVSMGITF